MYSDKSEIVLGLFQQIEESYYCFNNGTKILTK